MSYSFFLSLYSHPSTSLKILYDKYQRPMISSIVRAYGSAACSSPLSAEERHKRRPQLSCVRCSAGTERRSELAGGMITPLRSQVCQSRRDKFLTPPNSRCYMDVFAKDIDRGTSPLMLMARSIALFFALLFTWQHHSFSLSLSLLISYLWLRLMIYGLERLFRDIMQQLYLCWITQLQRSHLSPIVTHSILLSNNTPQTKRPRQHKAQQ